MSDQTKNNVLAVVIGVEQLALSDFKHREGYEDGDAVDEAYDDGYEAGYLRAINDIKRNIGNQ